MLRLMACTSSSTIHAEAGTAAGSAARTSPASALPCSPQVEVQGVDGELKRAAQAALTIRPNLAYTLKEVEDDLQKVFATGWFANVQPDAEDTRDGVKLFIKVGRVLGQGVQGSAGAAGAWCRCMVQVHGTRGMPSAQCTPVENLGKQAGSTAWTPDICSRMQAVGPGGFAAHQGVLSGSSQ